MRLYDRVIDSNPMFMKNYRILFLSAVLFLTGCTYVNNNPVVVPPPSNPNITVTSPQTNDVVKSPLLVTGEAKGTWYFEASFPVKLYDANNNLLVAVPAKAKGDWMTTNFVPFEVTLNFATPSTATGKLVLEKDNPSGLPQNADSITIPVKFDLTAPSTKTVQLFYYNASNDKDNTQNVMCTRKGLVAVERQIPALSLIIPNVIPLVKDTVNLLLKGDLTAQEKAQGISTEYPLPGFELKSVALNNGTLTLTFADPNNKTSGGSCRAGILWFQIEATAKQFPEVKTVKFLPEELFQP